MAVPVLMTLGGMAVKHFAAAAGTALVNNIMSPRPAPSGQHNTL